MFLLDHWNVFTINWNHFLYQVCTVSPPPFNNLYSCVSPPPPFHPYHFCVSLPSPLSLLLHIATTFLPHLLISPQLPTTITNHYHLLPFINIATTTSLLFTPLPLLQSIVYCLVVSLVGFNLEIFNLIKLKKIIFMISPK